MSKVVGIDLGTTYSAIAVLQEEGVSLSYWMFRLLRGVYGWPEIV